MPKINILNIQPGDKQTILIDKINYNFDQILTAGGGPQGAAGLIGPTGPIGPQGIQGPAGPQGGGGTRWYVQKDQPALNNIQDGNPWGAPQLGDYWLSDDTDQHPYGVYVYTNVNGSFQWVFSTVQFSIASEFTDVAINSNQGITDAIIIGKSEPQTVGVVISDYGISGPHSFNYLGNGNIPNIQFQVNSENAKLKIATDPNGSSQKLISFGRANYDSAPANFQDQTYSVNHNPSISWKNPSGTDYGIVLNNPQDSISIISGGSTSSITLDSSSINLKANTATVGSFSASGNNFTITRYNAGSYNSIGTGTYDVSGSYITFKPTNNFVVGNSLTSTGNAGSKGIVINSSQPNGNYLVLKSSAAAAQTSQFVSGDSYGGVVAESYTGNTRLAGVTFAVGANGSSTEINFNVSDTGNYDNRLTLTQQGSIQFRYGSSVTGSSRDVNIYIQDDVSNTTGANLTVKAGSSNGGNYQGGTLYLSGGTGGGVSGNSGNVVINPGYNTSLSGSTQGNVYMQTNGLTSAKSNVSGVGIGLAEGSTLGASLTVTDANPNVIGGDILRLLTANQTNPFFGFNKKGFLINGLPFNPNLTSSLLDPNYPSHNLDYYEENTWSTSLQINVRNPSGVSNFPSFKVAKANYTRIGDVVNVDFVIVAESLSTSVTLAPGGNLSDSYMYITGFPYDPDFSQVNISNYGVSISSYSSPSMPMIPLKSVGLGITQQGTNPVGTIQIWPGTTAPTGWLLCHGQELDVLEYPELASAIGYTYSHGISGAKFSIPDLRGYFIRGLNNDASSLPDYGRPGGLGSLQQDSIQYHTHSRGVVFPDNGQGNRVEQEQSGGADGRWTSFNVPTGDGTDTSQSGIPLKGNFSIETRPKNIAMNYIIYVGQPSTSNFQPMDIAGSFVQESNVTNFYLYDTYGALSALTIPYMNNKYIYGSFSYNTFSSTPYGSYSGIAGCTTPPSIIQATYQNNSQYPNGAAVIKYTLGQTSGSSTVVSAILEYSTDGGSTWNQDTGFAIQSGASYPTTYSYTFTAVSLAPGSTALFRMRQSCSAGTFTGNSSVYSFPVPSANCPAPTIQSINYDPNNAPTTITFSISAPPPATGIQTSLFDLWSSTDGTTFNSLLSNQSVSLTSGNGTITAPKPSQKTWYQLRQYCSVNSQSNPSAWSGIVPFVPFTQYYIGIYPSNRAGFINLSVVTIFTGGNPTPNNSGCTWTLIIQGSGSTGTWTTTINVPNGTSQVLNHQVQNLGSNTNYTGDIDTVDKVNNVLVSANYNSQILSGLTVCDGTVSLQVDTKNNE